MPKFKIEMELTSINDRLLLTDFDSSSDSIGGVTFNESLSEEENDQYILNFSIEQDFGRNKDINIGSLISIGRPIWVHTYNPNKSIRMVISSFSSVIGSENLIYEVEAQDYASYTFSKNNVGLFLDTIEDEEFLDWLKEVYFDDPELRVSSIRNIANHILERGWLQKRTLTESETWAYEGWTVFVDNWVDPEIEGYRAKNTLITSLLISDSNTYNGLVEIARTTNTHLKFNYDSRIISFIDNENLNLDKNYTLQRDVNIQTMNISYDGNNLYSLFYVQGAENEFGLTTILSDAVDYKDNFIFDFNYFKDRQIITQSQYNSLVSDIEQKLKLINQSFQDIIKRRYQALEIINNAWTRITNAATELLIDKNLSNYDTNFLNLESEFFQKSGTIATEAIVRQIKSKEVIQNWNDVFLDFRVDIQFPIVVNYLGTEFTFTSNSDIQTIAGRQIKVDTKDEESSSSFTYTNPNNDNLVIYIFEVDSAGTFDFNNFAVVSSKLQYIFGTNFLQLLDSYPFFDRLYAYDGLTTIDEKRAFIQKEIDTIKNLWIEDFNKKSCLEFALNNATYDYLFEEEIDFETYDDLLENLATTFPRCEDVFVPRQRESAEAIIAAVEEIFKSYEIKIGVFNPQTEVLSTTRLGELRTILHLFDFHLANYVAPTRIPVMETYRKIRDQKQNFWYELKKDKQHIFVEGYYDNEIETNPLDLLIQAETFFENYKKPLEDFGITYIDISDLVGVDIQNVQVGDFVTLKEEKLEIQQNKESKLKVASISKELRNPSNISLTIFRYNIFNTILDKIMANSQK